ncbi:T9SS type A sorting domain-containing protein [bacterium]|nr:T9SS type A sorting domain-containing protein [bacterium]
MGDAKLDDTPHDFTINGLHLEQYMSPSDGVTARVIGAVESADENIYFAMLAFTHNDISDAMRNRRTAVPDLSLAGVFEQDQGDCTSGGEYWRMHGDACAPDPWSPAADVWLDAALSASVLLHHKYLIIDTPRGGPTGLPDKDVNPYDSTVLTGSHNWSYSAESINDENTLVIHDYGIANLYLQEFSARYAESGGSELLGYTTGVGDGAGEAPRTLAALRAWPNPFNPQVNLSFVTVRKARLDVTVHDARGRLVRTLARDDAQPAGLHVLGWDGRGEDGRAAASGAYFLRVSERGGEIATHRVILVR